MARISEELRFALTEDAGRGAGLGVTDYQIAQYVGDLLGLPYVGRDNPTAESLLLDLIPSLEEVVAGRAPRDIPNWGKTTLIRLTKELTQEEAYSLLKAFGWEDERITGDPKFSDLAKVMKRKCSGTRLRRHPRITGEQASEGVDGGHAVLAGGGQVAA